MRHPHLSAKESGLSDLNEFCILNSSFCILSMDYLSKLENQSIYIMREAFNKFDQLAMLWSIGKDSTVLLWLARKAFCGHVPFPLVHVDTTYKIPSMIEYRDRLCREWKLDLIVGQNDEVLQSGMTYPNGNRTRVECCGTLKKDALRAVLDKHHFTGVIVGVRRNRSEVHTSELQSPMYLV